MTTEFEEYELKATLYIDEDDKCSRPEGHELYNRGYTALCDHCEYYSDFDGLDFTFQKALKETDWKTLPGGNTQTIPVRRCNNCQALNLNKEKKCVQCGKRL